METIAAFTERVNDRLAKPSLKYYGALTDPGLICVIKYERAQSLVDELTFIPHLNHTATHDDVIEWKHFSGTGPL